MLDFKAKVHQIRFLLGAPSDPLAVFNGPTSKGREGKGCRAEGKGRGEEGGKEGKEQPVKSVMPMAHKVASPTLLVNVQF